VPYSSLLRWASEAERSNLSSFGHFGPAQPEIT
jgi:hypothetical protein